MAEKLTDDERRAIASLRRLEKQWPKSLWLFSASGSLLIMKKGDDGKQKYTPYGAPDPACIVGTVNIENDGGDF